MHRLVHSGSAFFTRSFNVVISLCLRNVNVSSPILISRYFPILSNVLIQFCLPSQFLNLILPLVLPLLAFHTFVHLLPLLRPLLIVLPLLAFYTSVHLLIFLRASAVILYRTLRLWGHIDVPY